MILDVDTSEPKQEQYNQKTAIYRYCLSNANILLDSITLITLIRDIKRVFKYFPVIPLYLD